jgi:hypothetical protein
LPQFHSLKNLLVRLSVDPKHASDHRKSKDTPEENRRQGSFPGENQSSGIDRHEPKLGLSQVLSLPAGQSDSHNWEEIANSFLAIDLETLNIIRSEARQPADDSMAGSAAAGSPKAAEARFILSEAYPEWIKDSLAHAIEAMEALHGIAREMQRYFKAVGHRGQAGSAELKRALDLLFDFQNRGVSQDTFQEFLDVYAAFEKSLESDVNEAFQKGYETIRSVIGEKKITRTGYRLVSSPVARSFDFNPGYRRAFDGLTGIGDQISRYVRPEEALVSYVNPLFLFLALHLNGADSPELQNLAEGVLRAAQRGDRPGQRLPGGGGKGGRPDPGRH